MVINQNLLLERINAKQLQKKDINLKKNPIINEPNVGYASPLPVDRIKEKKKVVPPEIKEKPKIRVKSKEKNSKKEVESHHSNSELNLIKK